MALAAWSRQSVVVGEVSSPAADRQLQFDETALLAQLHQLPNGTISLPDFDLRVNGFQFSNQELIEAIDLQRNASDWEAVMTEQLQRLFGSQICLGQEARACVLTSAAQDWLRTQLGRMNQGISDGMAAAVLSLWQPQPQRIAWWQRLANFLLGRTVFGLARTLFDLQTYVANLFLMQSVPEVFQQTQVIRDSLTPTQIFLSMLNIFLGGARDPLTLGIYRVLEGVLTKGHSLTPYRIEERGDGQYWVYVYDSNYPAGRPTSPTDLHIEFDTVADTWRYQPTPETLEFRGNASSHTLDFTQLSWRQPTLPEMPDSTGLFTCPFCQGEAVIAEEDVAEVMPLPTVNITLRGEGRLTVRPYGADPMIPADAMDQTALVPFRGGLSRDVPANYHLLPDSLDRPFEITLTGTEETGIMPAQSATLQVTGPGYTANFENLSLLPGLTLILYVVPKPTGPELTFVANRTMIIPTLSIHLSDETNAYSFDSSTPEGYSRTERQVSRSSGFEVSGLQLAAGNRVAVTARDDLKRLYFADDDLVDSQYSLTAINRMVIRDRIQLGRTQPDFLNYTLTYEEELRARNLLVDGNAQAFFDYAPTFVEVGTQFRQALLDALEQQDIPITITYEPLDTVTEVSGPLVLRPSDTAPIGQRVFQASLRSRDT